MKTTAPSAPPTVGTLYLDPTARTFEVISIEANGTITIQYIDGPCEAIECEKDHWPQIARRRLESAW